MPNPRDTVLRLAKLTAALQEATGRLPSGTQQDAQRCVLFACRCIINEEGLPPHFITFGLPELRDSFEMAARWADGEEVSETDLRRVWDSARSRAATLSSNLEPQAAAHWAIVFAIEAAMHAAHADSDPARFKRVAAAGEAASRYALLAHRGHSAGKAVAYQTRLLGEIFPSSLG